jgi:glyoxylase-like metal-dependent hydrolase (beta-lactamase superfamily II)
MKAGMIAAAVIGLGLWTGQASAQTAEKLYILNCGEGHASDESRWSPGINVGKPRDVSDNCYLIRHAQGWFLWDTGIVDSIADRPPAPPSDPAAIQWRRPKKLETQLADLGVKPDDIKFMAVSHTHPDHIGNVELFPKTMLLVQKAEYDWPLPLGLGRFKPEHPVTKLEGDKDVFGDGSIRLISTPGHTPGHQSLVVKLPKTGTLVLSGDATHFMENFENRRVPAGNTDAAQTQASMQRIAGILEKEKAKLWINHDKAQSDTLKYAPAFYD